MRKKQISRGFKYIPLPENFDAKIGTNNKPLLNPWLKDSEKVPEPQWVIAEELETVTEGEQATRTEKTFFHRIETLRKCLVKHHIRFEWDTYLSVFKVTYIKAGCIHLSRFVFVDAETNNYTYTEADWSLLDSTKRITGLLDRLGVVEKWS